ncbi:MAG: hypothetical protein JWO52_4293, partial [Gammaproteobacteria bacterium]|nr:hypothetical protein [Gammaproteobacteria bacterium]
MGRPILITVSGTLAMVLGAAILSN